MAIPDMQMLEHDDLARRNQTGFENASVALLRTFVESLLSEICSRTSVHVFVKLAVGCECMRTNALIWEHFKVTFKDCIDEANMCNNAQHECCEHARGLPAIEAETPSQRIGGKAEGQRCSVETSFFSTCRLNINAQYLIQSVSLKTSILSGGKEEEDDLSGRCRARSLDEPIKNLERIHSKDMIAWISVAKNKDDDNDDDEFDVDEEEDNEDDLDDDEGEDNAKDGEDPRGGEDENEEDEDEGDDEDELDDDEDDEGEDEDEDEDEEEAPPKKKKK